MTEAVFVYLLKAAFRNRFKKNKKRISDCFIQTQISGSKPALWEMYEICLQGHFWGSSHGPPYEIKRKEKWRHREMGSYPCGKSPNAQPAPPQSPGWSSLQGFGAVTSDCHSTWGHSQGGPWWETNCLYRLNQGWEARTGPSTSGSTAPKAPEKLC